MRTSKSCFLLGVILFLTCFPAAGFAQSPGDGDDDGEEIIEAPPDEDVPPPPDDGGPPPGDDGASSPEPAPSYSRTLDGPGPVPAREQRSSGFLPHLRKPPRIYNPSFGFQGQFFVATHPTDTYFGVSFSAQFHLSPQFSASFDLRAGGGLDNDGDHYTHPMGTVGGSLAYWWHGWDRVRNWRPYLRVGAGWMGLGEETFDDGSDDDDDDWDKSRTLKKNGTAAPGHSNLYLEEAAGLRWVLFPRLWYLAVGGAVDLELALVQDFHYGFSDSGVKFSFGLTIFF